MPLLNRKRAILAKIEPVYGQDAAPDGAADAILLRGDPQVTPMDLRTVDRDLLRTHFGNTEKTVTSIFTKVDFQAEIAGSGTAGTAPAWGAPLRGCGFSQTITPGTKVEYKPVSSNQEALSIYFNVDGVLHKMTGARGTVKLGFSVDGLPLFNFSFMGLYAPVVDAAMPALTLSAWKKPLPINPTNTPTFSLHGYAAKLLSLDIDVANEINDIVLLNDSRRIDLTDRQSTGKVVFEATTVAQKNWWSTIADSTLAALQLIHGTTAGNKVQIDAPAVQILNPTYTDQKKIVMLNADLSLLPTAAGNDELVITAL
ncbi:MAG: hypothetical protein KGZ68_12530 [Dechloromonas sp.]|nr:hypothetical protein [Dechloromonas sp.]